MAKLLVNNPQGDQEIIEVGQGGGYFDESLVLWDDRKHGEMPSVDLGAMEAADVSEPVLDLEGNPVKDENGDIVTRKVRRLSVSPSLKDAHTTKETAREADRIAKESKRAARKASLSKLKDANTIKEIRDAILPLIEILNEKGLID